MSPRVQKIYKAHQQIAIIVLVLLLVWVIGVPSAEQFSSLRQEPAAQKLLYGYAAPTAQSPGVVQISEFNSFIGHENVAELYNSSSHQVIASIDIINFDGTPLSNFEAKLAPHGSARVALDVPGDTYGTLIISGEGVIFRNYIRSQHEYVLPFAGQ